MSIEARGGQSRAKEEAGQALKTADAAQHSALRRTRCMQCLQRAAKTEDGFEGSVVRLRRSALSQSRSMRWPRRAACETLGSGTGTDTEGKRNDLEIPHTLEHTEGNGGGERRAACKATESVTGSSSESRQSWIRSPAHLLSMKASPADSGEERCQDATERKGSELLSNPPTAVDTDRKR